MITQTRRISIIVIASIWCLTIISGSFLSVNAQQPDSNHLPILLIHGYGENSNIWNSWIDWLRGDHFDNTTSKVYSITFPNHDQCGSAEQHADKLRDIVNSILSATHSDKVNIVAHSKGGLDARQYIVDNNIDKVANLIMIGTPNGGTTAAIPAAFGWDVLCPSGSEGLKDLLPSSDATRAVDRLSSTHYYTIAGTYSVAPNCYYPLFYWFSGNCLLGATNDLLVTVSSVQCSPDHCYNSLEVFPYDHLGLLTHKDVYEKVLPILSCGRVICGLPGGTSSFS
jgi:pimeloyl-ACP methyl ester carboxylesterase